MSWAASLEPATLADQMIGAWAQGGLSDLLQGMWPGLRELNQTQRAMRLAPFTKQAGGGVENVGYRNQLVAGQYPAARGQVAGQALDLQNLFANLLTGDAASLLNLQTMIQQGRNANSGGLLGALGL